MPQEITPALDARPLIDAMRAAFDGTQSPDMLVPVFAQYRQTEDGHRIMKGLLDLMAEQGSLRKVKVPNVFDGMPMTTYFFPPHLGEKAEIAAIHCGAVFAGTDTIDHMKETLDRVIRNRPEGKMKDFYRSAKIHAMAGGLEGLKSRPDLLLNPTLTSPDACRNDR